MKVRNGFVSNSSTSSFCIYGIYIEGCCLDDFLKQNLQKMGCVELLNKIPEESNLSTWCIDDDDSIFIGIPWYNIRDDETGKDFKNRVKHEIEKIILPEKIEELSLETYEEAYCD